MTEKKLNVCFVSIYSPKVIGGIGTYLIGLSTGLKEKGIDNLIITKHVKDGIATNANLYEIPFEGPNYIRSIIFYSKCLFTIFKLRKKINIINTQTQFIISLIVAIFGKFIGIPVVTTIHGPPTLKKKNMRIYKASLIEKLVLRFSNRVIFVDEQGKIDYRYKPGIVIENGINAEKLILKEKSREITREKFKLKNKFVILFTGRWVQVKGIFDLLEAFSKVKEKNNNICLIILGEKSGNDVESLIKKFHISDYVITKPEVKDIHEFLCAADLFVLPSYGEGLSMSMLEAMSCSLPVIVTDVGGTPYVIKDCVNGLLIKPGNIDELTKKILWCIEHEKERKELGLNARMTIEQNHDIKKVVDRYIKVYKQLL